MPSTNPTGASRHTDAEKIAIIRLFNGTRQRPSGPQRTGGQGWRGGRMGRMRLYRLFGISTGVLTKWRRLLRRRKLAATEDDIETARLALKALIPPRPRVVKPERVVKRRVRVTPEPEPAVQAPPPFKFPEAEEEPW